MNIYETIIIFDASLTDEATESSIQRVKDLITAEGGEVLKTDPWGRRRMTYEINKHQRGYYVLFLFKAPPATIKKMEDFFKVHDPVVKTMTVRLEKKQREAALRSLVEEAQAPEAPSAEVSTAEAPAAEAPAAETPAPDEPAAETAAAEE